MQEIEMHLDQSFDKIINFIDQVFIIDSPISKINNTKTDIKLPKVDQFHLMEQSEYLSNFFEQVKSLIKSKIKDQVQILSQQEQKYQQILINSQQSQLYIQLQNEMKSTSQVNFKPFSYEIIEANSIKQQESCWAISINKDFSIVAAGCNKLIKIYEFQQGMLKLNQVLNEHQREVVTLNFVKQSNQLISGDQGYILIWQYNNNSWICSQTIDGHNDWIRCIILNNNEDLFISSSADKTIKFWVKKNEWIYQQTITDHSGWVNQLSLNEQQNQVISCGYDGLILVIEQSETNKNWIVKQKIQVDCIGYRLCFINDNLFTYQPVNGNLMYVYEMNSVSKQFTKSKDIRINQGNDSCLLFPQQFIKQKQLVVNKHDKYVHLIRFTENAELKVEQSIRFGTNDIFGQLSDDGEYLITWDQTSYQIQIRKFKEQ
ncbi:unnamed protein product [Paramecium pentaurelia]|uniref:WD40-repeat-containing domain n=1 Tax=Paramecium pentaurelia TaxID=43138 RepID=A0A8S1YF34_9CILI|nr:unnamed protein product [Paramecium pentaurelia]